VDVVLVSVDVGGDIFETGYERMFSRMLLDVGGLKIVLGVDYCSAILCKLKLKLYVYHNDLG